MFLRGRRLWAAGIFGSIVVLILMVQFPRWQDRRELAALHRDTLGMKRADLYAWLRAQNRIADNPLVAHYTVLSEGSADSPARVNPDGGAWPEPGLPPPVLLVVDTGSGANKWQHIVSEQHPFLSHPAAYVFFESVDAETGAGKCPSSVNAEVTFDSADRVRRVIDHFVPRCSFTI